MSLIITVLGLILQILSLPIGIYNTIIGFFGFIPKKEKALKNNKLHKFALVTSAHNEDKVIKNLIESQKKLNYPKELYDIFVVADNCTDNTANIARNAGAIVFERSSDKRGKGFALEWIFEKIFSLKTEYDFICVFDADNLVHPDFLTEMNKSAQKGYNVIQGYTDSKNPFDSWITASYSLSFWGVARSFQLARHRLGLCCQLMGTGFSVSCKLLARIGWGSTCLTEDMDFTMRLALEDEKVYWAHNAVIYDEKPVHLAESLRQRTRWMQGHADVASRLFVPLVKKAFREKKLIPLDCAIYLMQPVLIIALGLIAFFGYAQSFYPGGNIGFIHLSYIFDSPWIWNTITIINLITLPIIIILERRTFEIKYILSLVIYPIYNLTWIPAAIVGIKNRKKTEWYHTKHTRSIEINEVN